jgi:signal transduction histidine kinase
LGSEAEVTVADRGIGIPPVAQPKIFERFYQVDTSSTRRYGGMGLGLAIVREILTAHGREIEVESEVGLGTTFRFTLALAALPVGAGEGRRTPTPAGRQESWG